MKPGNKIFTLNDPIYGFITIPRPIVFELIEHPYFQRLRRIAQMGLSGLVFPGANHTRFHHAIGAMHLMQKTIQTLLYKGVSISEEEEEALYIAILLHDIGHGPFSHAMENSIVEGVSHEKISGLFMERLNKVFNQKLTLAIEIFRGNYPRKFLCSLVSGQLDMDRLDYLKRDSFYAGTPEGNINSERLIAMLNVVDDELVVEEKGVYSLEKFFLARRFMYWQVYLHKTSIGAEELLTRILKRAKQLQAEGADLPTEPLLKYFMNTDVSIEDFTDTDLEAFACLDDYTVMAAINQWQQSTDFVLSQLCQRLINRKLLKVKLKRKPLSKNIYTEKLEKTKLLYSLPDEEAAFFVFEGNISNQAYDSQFQKIKILTSKQKVIDITRISPLFKSPYLTNKTTKHYLCFPKP